MSTSTSALRVAGVADPGQASPAPAVDPELSHLSRFFTWLGLTPKEAVGKITVRVAENSRGGWSLYPADDAARALMGDGETGNFPSASAARGCAAWNCWDVTD
jgi:hypothetical protein